MKRCRASIMSASWTLSRVAGEHHERQLHPVAQMNGYGTLISPNMSGVSFQNLGECCGLPGTSHVWKCTGCSPRPVLRALIPRARYEPGNGTCSLLRHLSNYPLRVYRKTRPRNRHITPVSMSCSIPFFNLMFHIPTYPSR